MVVSGVNDRIMRVVQTIEQLGYVSTLVELRMGITRYLADSRSATDLMGHEQGYVARGSRQQSQFRRNVLQFCSQNSTRVYC